MSEQLPAPLQVVSRVAGVSRSAACEARRRRGTSEPPRRRPGPVGAMTDSLLLAEIRDVLATSPFVGEGHRKVWARLRRRGVGTSRKRVLRLMREAGLLAPTAKVRKRAQRLHDGTITVTVPDTLWATDATDGHSDEGHCAVFVMIDHASGEAWSDAGLRMDRFAAADLLREVTTERFGSVDACGRRGAGAALRRRAVLSLRALPGRDRPPRDRPQPGVPLRARDQRLRGEVHPDAQGTGALDRALRDVRAAPRAPRLPHADRSTSTPRRACPGDRGMIAEFTKVSGEPGPGPGQRSGGTCVLSLDSAARCRDHASGESNDPTDDGGRKAKLDDGKRSGRCIYAKANDQPSNRPDHAYRRRTDDCPSRG